MNDQSVSLLNISVCAPLLCSDCTVCGDLKHSCPSQIHWYDSPGGECWGINGMGERFKESRVIENTREVKRETRIEMSVFILIHQVHFQCSKIREFVLISSLWKCKSKTWQWNYSFDSPCGTSSLAVFSETTRNNPAITETNMRGQK